MKFRIVMLASAACLVMVACGVAQVASGADGAAQVLKITRQPGTYVNLTVTVDETGKKTVTAGDKQSVTDMQIVTETQNGLVFGENKDGWQIVSAAIVTKITLKNYVVDGVDKKMDMVFGVEAPVLPYIKAYVGDDMGRQTVPAEAVADQPAWESYAIAFTRILPADGLADGAKWNGDVTIGGEKVGTYEFECKLVPAEDPSKPVQFAVTGKVSAQRKEGSVAIDDYSAAYDANGTWPSSETFTAKIVRNADDGTTEITRVITRELDQAKVLEGEGLKAVAGIYDLTATALDAIKKTDMTPQNYNACMQKVGPLMMGNKMEQALAQAVDFLAPAKAAADALGAAENAAPKELMLKDALAAWHANVSLFVPPAVGQNFKPFDVAKWINSDPIDMSTLKGKVIAVEFWATWCGPCVGTAPHLSEMYQTYGPKGLAVIAATIHRDFPGQPPSPDEADFVKQLKLTYPIAMDKPVNVFDQNGHAWSTPDGKPGLVGNAHLSYLINPIPTIFIFDKKGILRWVGSPADDKCEETIKALLEE